MALLDRSIDVYSQLGTFFAKIRAGQAPERFSRDYLKGLGLESPSWHASIGLMKGLGFLSSDGAPTQRYMNLFDETQWKKELAIAVREAYGSIFEVNRNPGQNNLKAVAGRCKSLLNCTESKATKIARTFLALWELADKGVSLESGEGDRNREEHAGGNGENSTDETSKSAHIQQVGFEKPLRGTPLGLVYNIQIHLPATKDMEVYNAIFKSLREHIVE